MATFRSAGHKAAPSCREPPLIDPRLVHVGQDEAHHRKVELSARSNAASLFQYCLQEENAGISNSREGGLPQSRAVADDAYWKLLFRAGQEAVMGFLLVFIGSGIGGVMRYGVGLLSLRLLGPDLPYATLATNIVGSGFMGLVIGLLSALNVPGQDARLFLTTGLLGGFTTFSAFSLDAVALWERGQHAAAIGYVLLTVVGSLIALTATLLMVRRWG